MVYLIPDPKMQPFMSAIMQNGNYIAPRRSRKNEKECAYFEYDNGNSKIATTCINTLKQKYERRLNHEPMSIEEVQRILSAQDIPIEIAKGLAVIILRDCFSAAVAAIHL